MPPLLREIIECGLRVQPGMTVVGDVRAHADLSAAVSDERPDVTVIGIEGGEMAAECMALLSIQPAMRVIGVRTAGGRAELCELRPHCVSLGEVGATDIVVAIRTALDRPRVIEPPC